MGFVSKQYLQTQFQNFATRISAVFAKKGTTNNSFSGYEEGTWTPEHGYTASATQFLLSEGKYTKIGNVVIARCKISTGAKSGTYEVYVDRYSLPWSMIAGNFMFAGLHDVYNGKKWDGKMADAVASISFGAVTFAAHTSPMAITDYYATIMYCI